jgi:hypothetical protein
MTTNKSKFTSEQKDLIFGSLLGDSNLSSNNLIGKDNACRLRISHKAAHAEFVYAKADLLGELVATSPQLYTLPVDERTGKIYERYWFNTLYTPSLRYYWGMFYKKQRDGTYQKELPTPQNLYAGLTPRALAWWYMDDGSLTKSIKSKGKSNAMRISAESFSYEGINRLCNVLGEKYNISANPQTKDSTVGSYVLYIQSKSAVQFADIIKPYLIDCMMYKVTDGKYRSLAD